MKLQKELEEEALKAKQKARIKYEDYDENTKHYHASLRIKITRNKILSIINMNGTIQNNDDGINNAFV